MSENNGKKDFEREKDERFSPDLVIRKKAKATASGGDAEVEAKPKSKFRLWMENFIYHYKWHSIAAIFLILVILFCILQTCGRVDFDSYILYAGGKNLRAANTDSYQTVYDALGRYVSDFDGDGNRHLSFRDIYLPSAEEIEEVKESGVGVNYSILQENDELFRQNMLFGDFYICFISERLYNEWTADAKNNPFRPIAEYLPEDAKIAESEDDSGYLLASEYGVYLKSLPSAARPGLKTLPDDTVVCIRKLVGFSDVKKKTQQAYSDAEHTFRLILADKTPE